jgi:hypothetical protein
MLPPKRMRVMVAANAMDAEIIKDHCPEYHFHAVLTPDRMLSGFIVSDYVWTPDASELPASVRLRLRGMLSPLIGPDSVEEEFSPTLLYW